MFSELSSKENTMKECAAHAAVYMH